MKKLVYTVFIGFWTAIGTLLLVNALAPDRAPEQMPQSASDAVEKAGYSLDEVARHASLGDCWMAIEGAVYDLSEYVPSHPARSNVLDPWCGREATEGMRTKGDDRDHSARAWRMLRRYRIGEVK